MPHTSERRVASRCSVSLPCAALRYLLLRAFASLIADDKYLGIHGSHYVHKIVAQEGMTMVLQTPYKLPTLARAATMAGATHPSLAVFDPWFERFYWLMLFALVFNAVFPGVLLRCKSERLQRHAVAACDAALDVLYFLIYFFVASCTTALSRVAPLTPFEFLATLYPLMRVYAVTVAVVTAMHDMDHDHQPHDDQKRVRRASLCRKSTRLSLRAAIGFCACALSVVGLVLLLNGIDGLYPFSVEAKSCQPCRCKGGLLTSCTIPAKLGASYLDLSDRGITGAGPHAFDASPSLGWLDLSRNRITAFSTSSLEGAINLAAVDLSGNNMSTIAGSFPQSLRTLALRGNQIAVMPSGALSSSGGRMRNLFLDDNHMRQFETGAFDAVGTVDNVWVGGNRVNCSAVRSLLPKARCLEERCKIKRLTWIGNGFCDRDHKPNVDTAQCAWDGGDCGGVLGRASGYHSGTAASAAGS